MCVFHIKSGTFPDHHHSFNVVLIHCVHVRVTFYHYYYVVASSIMSVFTVGIICVFASCLIKYFQ